MFDHIFCDITNSCPFSNYSTLTARTDLFLGYAILSHAFHTAKFELDNGRHFHALSTFQWKLSILSCTFDEKITISKVLKGQVYFIKHPFLARM